MAGQMATANPSTSFNLPETFWQWLVLQADFRRDIKRKGYYEIEKEAIAETLEGLHGRQRATRGPIAGKLPLALESMSFDFYSQSPEDLRRLGLFTIRTGKGNCVVFDSKVFALTYGGGLASKYFTERLQARAPKGYQNLVDSLSSQINEQSFIRLLHFSGVLKAVVRYVCGISEYEVGPSGHISSSFPFWMKDRKGRLVQFVFKGTSDMDECLYPRDTDVVMPMEAKLDDGVHSDLGWHKLAFPCYRFIDNSPFWFFSRSSKVSRSLKIVPLYCLYEPSSKTAYIYVFPRIHIRKQRWYGGIKQGLVLNDKKQFTPRKVFYVDMKKIGMFTSG